MESKISWYVLGGLLHIAWEFHSPEWGHVSTEFDQPHDDTHYSPDRRPAQVAYPSYCHDGIPSYAYTGSLIHIQTRGLCETP